MDCSMKYFRNCCEFVIAAAKGASQTLMREETSWRYRPRKIVDYKWINSCLNTNFSWASISMGFARAVSTNLGWKIFVKKISKSSKKQNLSLHSIYIVICIISNLARTRYAGGCAWVTCKYMPFYIKDLSIWEFWYLREVLKLTDNKGWLYIYFTKTYAYRNTSMHCSI